MSAIWFLCLLIIVPLIVHFFSFRKSKSYYFSNLKFITEVSVASTSRRRLQHFLILASRLFLFSLLLFLFYAFWLKKTETPDPVGLVYLDTTPSMSISSDRNKYAVTVNRLVNDFGIDPNKIKNDPRDLLACAHVFSDFQGWDELRFHKLLQDTTRKRNLVITSNINENQNVFIDSLNITPNPDDFSQTRIEVFLHKTKELKNRNLIFRLVHSGRQLSSVVQDSERPSSLVFEIPSDLYGDFFVEIEGDEVVYDNIFRFVIPARKKPSIVLIDSQNNVFLSNIFSNAALFQVIRLDINDLDFNVLNTADFIILNGVPEIPTGISSMLDSKSILLIPSSNSTDIINLNWMGINSTRTMDSTRYEVDVDGNHPLIDNIYTSIKPSNALPNSSISFTLSGRFETVLKLRNGNPFLVKGLDNNHYFLNAPLDLSFTNLPNSSLFLPLLYEMAFSSVGKDDRFFYYPGDLGFIKTGNRDAPPKIIRKDLEIIPDFTPLDNGLSFLIPNLKDDFYQVVNELDSVSFAVNIPKEESIMAAPTLSFLKEKYRDYSHVNIQSIDEWEASKIKNESSLWKYILILIVAVLLIESFFHKYLK